VYVEAEDVETVKAEMPPDLAKRIAGYANPGEPDYLQLLTMAKHPQGGIIANSTFSWWAGWLHPFLHSNPGVIVSVERRLWFGDAGLTAKLDLVPQKEWRSMSEVVEPSEVKFTEDRAGVAKAVAQLQQWKSRGAWRRFTLTWNNDGRTYPDLTYEKALVCLLECKPTGSERGSFRLLL
jgi:hypothetical protein